LAGFSTEKPERLRDIILDSFHGGGHAQLLHVDKGSEVNNEEAVEQILDGQLEKRVIEICLVVRHVITHRLNNLHDVAIIPWGLVISKMTTYWHVLASVWQVWRQYR
jgi:hypothetical protein